MHQPNAEVRNWSGTLSTQPAALVKPRSVDEILTIVRSPVRYPSPVRAMGSYHSTTPCPAADFGTLLDMRDLNRVLKIGGDYVRVQAGAQYLDVARQLRDVGRAFYVNLEIGNATVGSIATCASKDAAYPHEFGQAGAYVTSLTIVDARGQLETVGADQPERLQALRSSYGLLGIVVEVTLRVRRLVPIAVEHRNYTTGEFLDRLPELRTRNGSLMYYIFPYADRITAQLRAPGDPGRWRNPFVWPLRNLGVAYGVPLAGRLIRLLPGRRLRNAARAGFNALTRWMLQALLHAHNSSPDKQITRYRHRPWLARFTFSIWAFPEDRFPQVLRAYRKFCADYDAAHGYRPELLTVGYRVSQSQHSLLSYSFEGPVMTIDPVAFGGPQWDAFAAAFNEFCIDNGGAPLLNQTPGLNGRMLRLAFGDRWQQLHELRRDNDPDERFLNAYFRDLLEPATAGEAQAGAVLDATASKDSQASPAP